MTLSFVPDAEQRFDSATPESRLSHRITQRSIHPTTSAVIFEPESL
jgi:hypothetical protein